MDRDAGLESDLFHGGKRNFMTASARAVRLRDHRGDFQVRLGKQMPQRGDSELGGAAENQTHFRGSRLPTDASAGKTDAGAGAMLSRWGTACGAPTKTLSTTTRLAFAFF